MDVRVKYRLEGTEVVLRPWIFKRGRRPVAHRIAQWAHSMIVALAFLFAAYCVFYVFHSWYRGASLSSAIWGAGFFGAFILAFTAYFVLPAPSMFDLVVYLLLGYRIVHPDTLAAERRAQSLGRMDSQQRIDFLWKEYMAMLRGGTPYASISWKRDRIVPYLNAKGLAAFEHEEGLAMAAGEAARQQQDQAYQEGFMTGYMLRRR
jgi:hypothetical protein